MQFENISLEHLDRFDHVKEMDDKSQKFWLQKEKIFWDDILNILRSNGVLNNERSVVESYLRTINGMLVNANDITSLQLFQDTQPLPFHDEHPHAEHMIEFAKNNQFQTARYLFQSLILQQSTLYINKYKSELKHLEEQLKNTITSEHETYTSSLTENRKSFNIFAETTKKDVQDNLKEQLELATTEISNTVTAATNAILSAEPVKYWEEREKKHRTKARSYRKGVITASLFFVSILVFLTFSVYKNGETYNIYGIPLTLPVEKFSIALLIICTTAAIWLIRILVKLMMTNLALEIEALERSTMIKTYIAMDSTKAEQAAEIRMLFYTTLFRPSSNSLTDDSTSPEYIRIIEAMLQKK
ncbi:DUF6161 domain-containing protein [Pseudomonas sp. A1230]|uniref:DUF6161 domain-containing protein n=1 Tax=Pseudomonas sp. A1230 TaxID=3235106 RepID=UPI0037834DAD